MGVFAPAMIQFVILISRQGRVRLSKWYTPRPAKEKAKIQRELANTILSRQQKLCNFLEWRDMKVIYKRYASLFFVIGVDDTDNDLLGLEVIHHFVEILDRYFGNVCELDLIFNFHKAYYILDELVMSGELQETSKKAVLRVVAAQDAMMENPNEQRPEI